MATRMIPRQFQAGPHTIKVRVVSAKQMRLCNIAANGPKAADEPAPWGLWVAGESTILLQNVKVCFNAEIQYQTFWHEYFHALFDLVGEARLSANEGLVERCSIMHMQMLRSMK